MKINNRFCLGVGLVLGMSSLHALGATTWDIGNNRVTYSVFQDNFELGQDEFGNNLTQNVLLPQLDLTEVAQQEGVGTSANFVLSSVVLSMNGVVYGSISFQNNSASLVTPSFKVFGTSELTYGADVTPAEAYSSTTPIGTIAPYGQYSAQVNIPGSATPKTVTITDDLARFLGVGTIETIGAFPVDGWFSSGGTDFDSTVSLQGKADITVTYLYDYTAVPEPSSVGLFMVGCIILALRRGRIK